MRAAIDGCIALIDKAARCGPFNNEMLVGRPLFGIWSPRRLGEQVAMYAVLPTTVGRLVHLSRASQADSGRGRISVSDRNP